MIIAPDAEAPEPPIVKLPVVWFVAMFWSTVSEPVNCNAPVEVIAVVNVGLSLNTTDPVPVTAFSPTVPVLSYKILPEVPPVIVEVLIVIPPPDVSV